MNNADIKTSGPLSLPLKSGVPILRGQRVTLDGDGLLAVAGNSELGIGTAVADATFGVGTSGSVAAVNLFNEGGSLPVQASGTITAGAKVQLAASGRVAAFTNGTLCGIAVTGGSNLETVQVIFN
jgi:predicted RecA/RadA family phage recombinase